METVAGKSIKYFESLGNRDYAIVPHLSTNDFVVFDRRVFRYNRQEERARHPLPLAGKHYPDYETAIAAVTAHITGQE